VYFHHEHIDLKGGGNLTYLHRLG